MIIYLCIRILDFMYNNKKNFSNNLFLLVFFGSWPQSADLENANGKLGQLKILKTYNTNGT